MSPATGNQALAALTAGLFDYAGMFPPAARSFGEALAESARLGVELGRPGLVAGDLVIESTAAARLNPETLRQAGFAPERAVQVCVLGSTLSAAEPLEREAATLVSLAEAGRATGPRCRLISYEVKIPRLGEGRSAIEARLEQVAPLVPLLCLEPDLSRAEWVEELAATAAFIGDIAPRLSKRVALKLRCGGSTAIDATRLSAAIVTGADQALDLKATGGLHHPFIDSGWGNSLGFLSLAVALALRRHHGGAFPAGALTACLQSSRPEEFTFGAAARWREWEVPAADIAAQRGRFHLSIGSCSLHEPDSDLARLFGPA